MPVEVAKLVDDFNKLWPRGTDPVSKADDHIRMIKEVLQLEFELLYKKTRVFSFEKGAVVNPDCILYYEAEKAFYQWNGAYGVNNEYIVNAGSTPETAGGIGGNAWTLSIGSGFMSTVLVGDTEPTAPFQNMLWWDTNSGTFFIYYNDGTSTQWVDLFGIADQASFNTLLFRSILARLAAESGYTLVDGSFQEGAISSGFSDVVLDWNTAKFYQWHLNENKVVPAGSTPATSGGIGAGAWVDRTDVTLRQALMGVFTALDLPMIAALAGLNVRVSGYAAAGDGGECHWFFDGSDQSANVTAYPHLYIAPNSDPSGASGAWHITHRKHIETWLYGVGSGYWSDHKTILEEIDSYNVGKGFEIKFPSGGIYASSLTLKTNKFEGVFTAVVNGSGGTGTVLLFDDAGGTGPCIDISGTASSRLTGLQLKNIQVVSKDWFNSSTKTNRQPWSLNYVGGHISIHDVLTVGFAKDAHFNEVWDGNVIGWRQLYCGTDATYPALNITSDAADNSNALHFFGLHIEHSQYLLNVGTTIHVYFHSPKLECGSVSAPTSSPVTISGASSDCEFIGLQGVMLEDSEAYFINDNGNGTKFIGGEFTSGGAGAGSLGGVKWYNGEAGLRHQLIGVKMTSTRPCGGNQLDYPIKLGHMTRFSGLVACNSTVTTSGLISYNDNCKIDVALEPNQKTKAAGAVFYGNGVSSKIEFGLLNAGRIYSVSDGITSNKIERDVPYIMSSSKSIIDVYGYEMVIFNDSSAQSVTQFKAMVGEVFNVTAYNSNTTLKHNASLLVLAGSMNATIPANGVITLMCINSLGKCIEVSRRFT